METIPSSDLIPELQDLVSNEVISEVQAHAVQTALKITPTHAYEGRSRRSLISEALTYIGGAVIAVSAVLLLSTTWDSLGQWGRPGVLLAAGVVLGLAAVLLGKTDLDDARRRLCSTLYVGSAAITAFAFGLLLSEFWVPKNEPFSDVYIQPAQWVMPTIFVLSTALAAVITVLGYRRANSAFGVLGIASSIGGFSMSLGMLIWWQIKGEETYPFLGFIGLFIAACVWLVLANRNVFDERIMAQCLALLALVISTEGMRTPLPEDFASIALVGLGLVMLWKYMQTREWVYLVGGVAPMLMGGIEFLTRNVSGALGSLASMIFGIAILVVGLRLFKEKQA